MPMKIDSLKSSIPQESQKIEQLKQAAQDFESLFLNIVIKSMRDSVEKSDLVSGGNAEDIYRSLLDTEYAKMMSKTNMSQLSEKIVEQLSKNLQPRVVVDRYADVMGLIQKKG